MAKGRKTGGRQKGTPNRTTSEAKQAAEAIVDDKAYRDNLQQRAKEGKLHPGVETMLWHYAKGKPKETIVHEGLSTATLSDTELRDRLAALLAKL
jgi:hypothetical protein